MEPDTAAHLISVVEQLWVYLLAVAGTLATVATLIWHVRYETRRFHDSCDKLHAHPDLIHAHEGGHQTHIHSTPGVRAG
jgi:hypothetical protein